MSAERIEKLLKESMEKQVPVPRKAIKNIKEDSFSKKLRRFDNIEIQFPFINQSGVYINTNENGTADSFKTLTSLPSIAEPFHFGFSGWHNFDIIIQRHSSRAIICDINPENALFLSYVLKYLRLFEDKDMFIQKMTQFVKERNYAGDRVLTHNRNAVSSKSIKFSFNTSDEEPYSGLNHMSLLDEISIEEERETSWLYTKERYAYIRKLALQDKIAIITENICKSTTFSAICRFLTENSMQIDTVYVSNIKEWISTTDQREQFLKTIQCLLTESETILIDAQKTDNENSAPTQRCIIKKALNEQYSLKKWFFSDNSKLQLEEKQNIDSLQSLVNS